MKTTKVVNDGRDEENRWALLRGCLDIRFDGIIERVKKGDLNHATVMCELQAIAEKRVKILDHPETDQDRSNIPDLEWWRKFYLQHFNFNLNFIRTQVPIKPMDGKWRLLLIMEGLTNNLVYNACDKKFPCYKYIDDLDKDVPKNERDSKNGNYAIWVRNTVEADEVHMDKSAVMIAKEGLKTETLLERMLHELVYFTETSQHLDVSNVTLCCGSRVLPGGVPYIDWCDGRFRVSWDGTEHRDELMRPREVVEV